MNEQQDDFRDSPQAAPRLRDELRNQYVPRPQASAEFDRRIAAATRLHFAQVRRITRFHRLAPFAAAAAAIMLAMLWMHSPSTPPAAPLQLAAGREDVDGNGRVDILDAFTLARHLRAAATLQPRWDVTGDGLVDRADVDAIALAAVSLSKG
jgi:hypothetical protein